MPSGRLRWTVDIGNVGLYAVALGHGFFFASGGIEALGSGQAVGCNEGSLASGRWVREHWIGAFGRCACLNFVPVVRMGLIPGPADEIELSHGISRGH